MERDVRASNVYVLAVERCAAGTPGLYIASHAFVFLDVVERTGDSNDVGALARFSSD